MLKYLHSNDAADVPSRLEQHFEQIISPFQAFVKDQKISAIILLLCTIAAITVANSPFAGQYEHLLESTCGFFFGQVSFSLPLRHWINEGLMSLFFFLLGIEIKRELLVGELTDARRAVPVIAAALGGMITPALIYFSINHGSEFAMGWGIPMATDTAFAVGILALLGSRIPPALTTFLTALAIIDDLGAILVIAIVYTSSIDYSYLSVSAIAFSVLLGVNLLGIRHPQIYLFGAIVVWAGMLESGIHATVAGVLVAAVVPARAKRPSGWFLDRISKLVQKLEKIEKEKHAEEPILANEEKHRLVEKVQSVARTSTTPLRRWEIALEHPVALFVMPVFAIANAGIPVDFAMIEQLGSDSLAIGIILALVLGKGIGIPLFAWLAIRLQWGRLPRGVAMRHIIGVGLLGGMGFTMSIFISDLGFKHAPEALMIAKCSILAASLCAGVAGYLWLRVRA